MATVTVEYEDGTIATGEAPLPELSPRQQDAADALKCLEDIEAIMCGRNGPMIRLRALIYRLVA